MERHDWIREVESLEGEEVVVKTTGFVLRGVLNQVVENCLWIGPGPQWERHRSGLVDEEERATETAILRHRVLSVRLAREVPAKEGGFAD
ncbi:MAG TPA: hypothetical protein VK181_27175 [Rhizobium sp.]|nr:hypothetical protein [Rhizobium sp.]